MNLGAEPKKVVILGGLMLVAAYSIYTNVLSGPDVPQQQARSTASTPATTTAPPPPIAASPSQQQNEQRLLQRRQLMIGRQSVGEFRPSLKPARPEDRPDPMKVDPTLRLELLAKLQNVTVQGTGRSLFELGPDTPAAAATPDVPKIIPTKAPPKKGFLETAMLHPQPKPPETKPAAAVKPPPPPIPLKFYGYSSPRTGGTQARRAFFLDGEDIFVVHEGDLVKKRYKIVEIKLNSVVVEDTEHKHQQTLPLEQPPANG